MGLVGISRKKKMKNVHLLKSDFGANWCGDISNVTLRRLSVNSYKYGQDR